MFYIKKSSYIVAIMWLKHDVKTNRPNILGLSQTVSPNIYEFTKATRLSIFVLNQTLSTKPRIMWISQKMLDPTSFSSANH